MAPRDGDLVEGYLRGDPRVTSEIDGWIEGAARPFYRKLGHQWDDILQEIRLEILELLRAGKFRGDSSLKSYLWRVVGHSCLDRVRSLKRWTLVSMDDSEEVRDFVDGRRQPEGLPAESADLLLRVLEKTTEECRRLWRMIVAGYSYREIGAEIGASEGALRVRALRCRKEALRIREKLLTAEVQ